MRSDGEEWKAVVGNKYDKFLAHITTERRFLQDGRSPRSCSSYNSRYAQRRTGVMSTSKTSRL